MDTELGSQLYRGLSVVGSAAGMGALILVGRLYEQHRQLWENYKSLCDFFIQRGFEEAKMKKIIDHNSPYRTTAEVAASLSPIRDDLVRFFREQKWDIGDEPDEFYLPDTSQFLAMIKQFGNPLVNVCEKFNLHQGACVVAAFDYARREAAKEIVGQRAA